MFIQLCISSRTSPKGHKNRLLLHCLDTCMCIVPSVTLYSMRWKTSYSSFT